MPGFNADAAHYKTKGYYMAGSPIVMARSHGVLPQLPIGFCQANCDKIQDPFLRQVCEIRCFDQSGRGGGGGGGGGQSCTPGCGSCHPDPDSPTGRYKTCVKRNCDTYNLRC